MGIATDLIILLRYKLRMIGVPIEGLANVFCDNEYVYNNASFYESQLIKKHQAIYFFQAMECIASNIIIFHKVDTNDNLADISTKSLPGWKYTQLRILIMYSDNPNISWEAS